MNDIPGIGTRREAREDALAALYELEMRGDEPGEVLDRRDVPVDDYAAAIVHGVVDQRERIDTLLADHLRGWRVERMAGVDRNLARMATWELIARPDVPTGVVLAEAVELATQYCGSESPRFLNGLLRAVADAVRTDTEES